MERRSQVQALRKLPDEALFPMFEKPLWCLEGDVGYIELQDALLQRFGLQDELAKHDLGGADPAG